MPTRQFWQRPDNRQVSVSVLLRPSENAYSNANGTIEPGEYANVVVQLTNPSLTNAMNVNATLSSSTAGVSITSGNFELRHDRGRGNASNSGTPFVIALGPGLNCGSPITLTTDRYSNQRQPTGPPFNFHVGTRLPLVRNNLRYSEFGCSTGTGFTGHCRHQDRHTGSGGRAVHLCDVKSAPTFRYGASTTTGGRYVGVSLLRIQMPARQCVTVSATSGIGEQSPDRYLQQQRLRCGYESQLWEPITWLTLVLGLPRWPIRSWFLAGSRLRPSFMTLPPVALRARPPTLLLPVSALALTARLVLRFRSRLLRSPAARTGAPYSQPFAAAGGSGSIPSLCPEACLRIVLFRQHSVGHADRGRHLPHYHQCS